MNIFIHLFMIALFINNCIIMNIFIHLFMIALFINNCIIMNIFIHLFICALYIYMQTLQSTLSNIKSPMNHISNIMKDSIQNNQTIIMYFMGILIVISTVLIVYYVFHEKNKKQSNTSSMKKELNVLPTKVKSINPSDAKHQQLLRDYYIMSSYNSCCNGDIYNGYVSLDALKTVISKGARVLDFEIYSVNEKTVVAASSTDNFYKKTTYNQLDIDDVMNIVKRYGFSGSTAPNFRDPLFIHFRIKSQKPHVFSDLAKSIQSIFGNQYILGGKYNNEYGGENMGTVPLKELMGKVIFMCDKTTSNFEGTPLKEYINMASGTTFLQSLRNYDVVYTPNSNDLINHNKKNMTISMPDLSKTDDNFQPVIHFKFGCQMICLNFQNVDSNLEYYIQHFNEEQTAFILKPVELRYQVKTAAPPSKQDQNLSYAPRLINKPYFKHEL
jgi:hypothetical protein